MVGVQMEVTLTCESNQPHVLEASTNLQTWFPVATNRETASSRILLLPSLGPRCFYRASVGRPLFEFAIAASEGIDLNGNNIHVDSFDSEDPMKSTFGQYDALKAGDFGDIASRLGLANPSNVGNATVMGHLRTGTNASLFTGPNGSVGSVIWHLTGQRGIEPGWWRNDLQLHLRDVLQPPGLGTFAPASGTYAGQHFKFLMTDGRYEIRSVVLNAGERMLVMGNVSLLVTSNITIAAGAEVALMAGSRFTLCGSGNTAMSGAIRNTGRGADFIYYGLPGNTAIAWSSGPMVGCIYAPNADLTLAGPGIFGGAVVARSVRLVSNFQVHYDQALGRSGPVTW